MQTRILNLGEHVYGLGVISVAVLCLCFHSFYLVESPAIEFPGRSILVIVAGIFFLMAALGSEFTGTRSHGAATLVGYYLLVVIVLLNGPVLIQQWNDYGTYENLAEQVATAAGALLVFAKAARARRRISVVQESRLTRLARIAFALCALVFGVAHFFYLEYTAQMVPGWLPPSQLFWAYVTGVGHIAAGLALLLNLRAQLAMVCLTVMYASFTPFVHLPMLIADPHSAFIWSENAINITLTGVAWLMAASFDKPTSFWA